MAIGSVIYGAVDFLFTALTLAIVARAVISWFRVSPYHPAVQILDQVTEPLLAPLRRLIPPRGMIDFSPLVAILLLQVVQQIALVFIASLF
jgi:YggT family protein